MRPANVDLNEVVANMTKMLRRVLGEDIVLQTNYVSDLALIHADTGMIEQVLMNLAGQFARRDAHRRTVEYQYQQGGIYRGAGGKKSRRGRRDARSP